MSKKTTGIIFTLAETLEELGITKNKLAVESKVRPPTIADITNGKAKAIQFDTLVRILDALNRISLEQGNVKRYTVEDVFEFGMIEE